MTQTTTRRRYSTELRTAQRQGKTIVASVEPYDGWPVTHTPRYGSDPEPWTIEGAPFRFAGRECHAILVPGRILQRAAHRTPQCGCLWVRNIDRKAWDRLERDVACTVHGDHDHWLEECPVDTEGPWVLWLCDDAVDERTITGDH